MRPILIEAATPAVRSAPDTSGVSFEGVTVRYGRLTALDEVSLSVGRGEVLCLLGPSGSGKSTLLRVAAGLERPASGVVSIDDTIVEGRGCHVEPERRRVGMVFQDYALFPHLTVSANVAFGLRGRPAAEVRATVQGLLARLDISRYAASYPHMLSGGERQRVALARAMAPGPRVLLMDEPFSSLDGRLRDDVRQQAMAFLRDAGTTTVVVTHDPQEAMHLADRIALLQRGRLMQCGRPDELYARPASLFAARVFSDVNELPGTVIKGSVETALGVFEARGLPEQARVSVCIRPEHLRLSPIGGRVPARVTGVTFLGGGDDVSVAVDGLPDTLRMRVAGRAFLHPGDIVHLDVHSRDVLVLPRADSIK